MTAAPRHPAPPTPGLDDQASSLRRLMASLEATAPRVEPARRARIELAPPPPTKRPAHAIAVASGKGGVGKTNLCVNLAIAMAQRGVRVTLLDADLGLANADVLCGVRVHGHLGHVLAGSRTIDDIAIEAPGGFRLLPGAAGVASLAEISDSSIETLLERVGDIDDSSDVLLIDCGAGIGRAVLSFLAAADRCVVVATPEPTAITDAYALIKVALGGGVAGGARLPRVDASGLGLVVNMASDPREAHATHERIAGVCERFLGMRPPMLGWAPRDDAVGAAVRSRTPFLLGNPRRPISTRIDLLARELLEDLALDGESTDRPGLVRRLLSLRTRKIAGGRGNPARTA